MHVTNREFTWATGKLHQLFLTQQYRSYVVSDFGVQKWIEIDDGQRSLAASPLLHLYHLFIENFVKLTSERKATESIEFDVHGMYAEGRGKVR